MPKKNDEEELVSESPYKLTAETAETKIKKSLLFFTEAKNKHPSQIDRA